MANYTVFGEAAPSYTFTVYDTGVPSIEIGNIFYLTDSNGPVIGYRSTGARVYIPNDPRIVGQPIRMRLYIGGIDLSPASPSVGAGQHVREAMTTTPTNGGWCEALWDEPVPLDYGPNQVWVLITYEFTGSGVESMYIFFSGLPSGAVASGDIGSSLVLNEEDGGYPRGRRSRFSVGGGSTQSDVFWYGTDVIIDGPPPPTAHQPVAAYGFNEGSGIIAMDTTGNGHDIPVGSSSYFTSDGYALSGVHQLMTDDPVIHIPSGAFTAVDFANQPLFTVMFWAQRGSSTAGDNWTVRQTAQDSLSVTAWGIMQSDGANTVFEARLGGFVTQVAVPHMPVDGWHHYTLTYNEYCLRGYIDGVCVGEAYNSGMSDELNDRNLLVFEGAMQAQVIDDLRFFDYALAPDAVAYYMSQSISEGERSGKIKYWNGTQWQARPLKVWNGTTWVARKINGYDGIDFNTGKG